MMVAVRTGQRFSDLLQWHPRDVDTLIDFYRQLDEAEEEKATEERFAQKRAELNKQLGR